MEFNTDQSRTIFVSTNLIMEEEKLLFDFIEQKYLKCIQCATQRIRSKKRIFSSNP
jgi:hypothetical protein